MRARLRILTVLLLAAGATGCATPPRWSGPVDITVELDLAMVPAGARGLAASTRPLGLTPPVSAGASDGPRVMLCVVDAAGRAQCHHRDGVLSSRSDAAGRATCPGADRRLRSPCADASACVFRRVPVPAEGFGLVIVDLEPPLFGVPRHRVLDVAVLSAAPLSAGDRSRIAQSIRGLADCLGPATAGAWSGGEPVALPRAPCEGQFCRLAQSRVRLDREPADERPMTAPRPAGRSADSSRRS
jgi:hypothetical protein